MNAPIPVKCPACGQEFPLSDVRNSLTKELQPALATREQTIANREIELDTQFYGKWGSHLNSERLREQAI